jgi:putative membrane protein
VFSKLGIILKWVILAPVLLAVVLLAVANDQSVPVRLNPFEPNDPVLIVELALYQVAFIFFVLGALMGALVVWSGQRKYRRRVRQQREEANLWQARAEWSERRQAGERPPSRATAFLPRPERS